MAALVSLRINFHAINATLDNRKQPRNVIFKKLSQVHSQQKGRKFGKSETDVMIFKIFSPKNLAKILAFFAQTTLIF
jgi:hypothetical protein